MIPAFGELLGIAPEIIFLAATIFARVGAAVSVLPAFGEQTVPGRVKLGAALAFSFLVGAIMWQELTVRQFEQFGLYLLVSETAIGLLLGLSLRVLIIALQIAGTVASQAISLSQLFGGGMGSEPQPAFSTLLVVAGLAFATMAGLHVKIAEMFAVSYDLFPVGVLLDPNSVAEWSAKHVSKMFSLGLTLAAPFVLAATIYNLGLGFISRAMPQLMVAFVGAPAISLAGLVLFMLATPLMLLVWFDIFSDQLLAPDLGFR